MKRWLLLFLLLAAPAQAQQSTAADRLALQIGQLIIQVQTQQDQIVQLQQQLADKTAELRKLTEEKSR